MTTPAAPAGSDRCARVEGARTRADYNARRAYAYAIGEELALQRTISADAYLFLYKELVRLCMDRTYCWAGVEWLANRLQTSQGTVKRWLTQLVSAGLIQRKPRPGGDTALTSIPALAAYDRQQHGDQAAMPQTVKDGRLATPPQAPPPNVTPPSAASFFAPVERITFESRDRSPLSRHTVKKHNPNPGLVGRGGQTAERIAHPADPQPTTDTPTVRRLIEVGVADPSVLQELQALPVAEINAICRYVAAQPNSYNPPGLIVALARTGFGPALLRKQGAKAAQRSFTGRLDTAGQSAASGELISAAPGADAPGEWSQLWADSKKLLAERVPTAEFAAWFEATRLITYQPGQAIIGVPNVFARDTLTITYQSLIVDALETLTGTRVAIQVVID